MARQVSLGVLGSGVLWWAMVANGQAVCYGAVCLGLAGLGALG